MRIVNTKEISKAVEKLLVEANYFLPDSLANRIKAFQDKETNILAKSVLSKLTENLDAAKELNVPICQDTGMAVIFLEIGQQVFLEGDLLEDAVNEGTANAYIGGYMRKSIVKDPLFDRKNTNDNTPAVIHTKIVPGDKIKITVAPKGFGSENMSRIKMFNPSAEKKDIVDFVTETVRIAGGNPCPPVVVGVGLGGTFEYAAFLAKKALTRDVDVRNPDDKYAQLENEMLEAVNRLNVGPQGFGGKTTALAVNIETFPTHIAGLPCAVNIGCHVTRHKSFII
ncbi:MAG: fumarate hydratase [Clostridiales bacterium]|nr:MAG: fumarate hydratase [Clostridiales bacterium]